LTRPLDGFHGARHRACGSWHQLITLRKAEKMPNFVRTIVTHVNDDGTSSFVERIVPQLTVDDETGKKVFAGNLLWGTKEGISAVGIGQHADPVTNPFFPGPGGHRFVIFTFLPESGTGPDTESTLPVAAGEDPMPGLLDAFDPDRPGMHKTDTIDYVYVVSGEMTLEVENGEMIVKAGDCIVQRGTWHAWRNRSDKPCVVIGALVGADRKDVK
jgi:mannose-6-phosphate isomerase-like protein (cupin superfamily)